MTTEIQRYPLAETLASPIGMRGFVPYPFEKMGDTTIPAEGAILLDEALGPGGVAFGSRGLADLPVVDLGIKLAEAEIALSAPIASLSFDRENGKIRFSVEIDGVARILIERREVTGASRFRPHDILVQASPINRFAPAEFIASTLTAALALADRTTVKVFSGNVTFGAFDLSLPEISNLLRSRQTAHRLMIIGKACGYEFEFPQQLSGAEIRTIAFIHHAIVDRTFIWPIHRHPLPVIANERNLELLKSRSQPGKIAIPRPIVENLLGHEIDLGKVNIVMEEAVIEDVDRIIAEASTLDGHEILTSVRSLAGGATIECPETPMLPLIRGLQTKKL
ncbi:MAG TPA: hypothetical protein VEZ90_00405 [Blastocatellia bacterium]|nr:hypothetical protein [Blastocatellia bacterium]